MTSVDIFQVRMRIGMYVVFLEDWFKVFDRERFFIVQLEEFSSQKIKILQELAKFLNISMLVFLIILANMTIFDQEKGMLAFLLLYQQ